MKIENASRHKICSNRKLMIHFNSSIFFTDFEKGGGSLVHLHDVVLLCMLRVEVYRPIRNYFGDLG